MSSRATAGTDYPATVVANCPVGATTVLIKWRTGRTGEYDWPISDVMALEDLLPEGRAARRAPAAPRRQGTAGAGRRDTSSATVEARYLGDAGTVRPRAFGVGDEVEARYLGDFKRKLSRNGRGGQRGRLLRHRL